MTMISRRGKGRDRIDDTNESISAVENGVELSTRARLKGDEKNIAILFFLYLLQGIPLGLMQAIPIILTSNGVGYKQQAQFSFVNWPFSMKLLWAPLVDSLYWRRMGKRKSWLVPMQYLIGFIMIFVSFYIDDFLAMENKADLNMFALCVSFFSLNFLAATQDIAVDGWALTMLKRENVGYASTCNSVGQTSGYLFGFVAFIALESASFCNTYIRSEPSPQGIVTLPGFLHFWGWIFVAATTLIFIFKSERPSTSSDENLSVKESYSTLLRIICLRPIRLLAIVLLTAKVAFSACDSLTGLKLIEAGVVKEKLALLAVPLVPLQLLLPLLVSKSTAGPNPMDIYLKAYPYRLGFSIVFAFIVWITPSFLDNGILPSSYYLLIFFVYSLQQIALYSMFVSQMAFFAKVSDPVVGGTYMTLINTLANLGGNWPATLSLWLVEGLTLKSCSTDPLNSCHDTNAIQECTANKKGVCETHIDGYYVETLLCTILGCFWLMWGRGAIRRLQSYTLSAYAVSSRGR